MHPADIQSEIKKAGLNQRMISQQLNVSSTHVSEVINKGVNRPSDRVMRFIAEKIGRLPHEVFPDYYFRKNRRR